MIRRDEVQTIKQMGQNKLHFNTEREKYPELVQMEQTTTSKMMEFTAKRGELNTAQEKRQEV